MRMTLKHWQRCPDGDFILTVEHKRWFRKPIWVEYKGSCTVWHKMPSFRRASVYLESALSDLCERARYEEMRMKEYE